MENSQTLSWISEQGQIPHYAQLDKMKYIERASHSVVGKSSNSYIKL